MKPPVPYHGGKSRISEQIVALLPPHETYVEPYPGSGAVLFAKARSKVEVVNDVDRAVMAFFEALRSDPIELARQCQLSPYHWAVFLEAVEGVDDDAIGTIERARRWGFVIVSQGFGAVPATRGWSRPSRNHRMQLVSCSNCRQYVPCKTELTAPESWAGSRETPARWVFTLSEVISGVALCDREAASVGASLCRWYRLDEVVPGVRCAAQD